MATLNGMGSANSNTEIRPWSNLPQDILVLLIKRLLICDRIQFRAVCKGWRLPVQVIEGLFPIPKLPWTMEYMWQKTTDSNRTLSICKLREADLHQGSNPSRSYIVENGIVEGRSNFVDAEACASRDGWVLFCKEGKGGLLFFFFSPFTKEVISLPQLESPRFEVATFSSAPTFPDCVVFVTHPIPPQSDKISISMYRPCGDDKTWNVSIFDVPEYSQSVESVAYMGGNFYCHFGCFEVTSFNIASQKWRIIRTTFVFDIEYFIDTHSDKFRTRDPNYLLECDGELLLAYAAKDPSPLYRGQIDEDEECFHLFRLDWKRKAWDFKNTLRGGAIFIGKTSFWISRGGETEMVENRVHHYSRGTPKFFIPPWDYPSLLLENVEKYREECKICYHPCTEGLKTIWIAPPREI